MTRIAIVILNWNGKHFLEKFLPSVTRYSSGPGKGIVVADNGSTDDSVLFLEKNYPAIRLLKFDRNLGFSGGYNEALKAVEAEYYVLLNSDVEVTPRWIEPIITLMDSDNSVAACMPKILDFHRKEGFEYAGAAGGFIDTFGYTFCRGRIFNVIEEDHGQYDDTREIFWATGACLFIRAKDFHGAGGFDPDFFAHMEEIDLCWRLQNRGRKILYSSGSHIFHFGGGALPMNHPHKTYLNFRNNLFLLYKNLPPRGFRKRILLRLILDGIAAAKFLAGFEFRNFLSVIRAHISFFRSVPALTGKRKDNLLNVTTSDHPGIYPRSLVFDFFFRGRKRFSELHWQG